MGPQPLGRITRSPLFTLQYGPRIDLSDFAVQHKYSLARRRCCRATVWPIDFYDDHSRDDPPLREQYSICVLRGGRRDLGERLPRKMAFWPRVPVHFILGALSENRQSCEIMSAVMPVTRRRKYHILLADAGSRFCDSFASGCHIASSHDVCDRRLFTQGGRAVLGMFAILLPVSY